MSRNYKERTEVYAILRYDRDMGKIEESITVKEIVSSEDIAKSEVERLNKLNSDKDCFYWYSMSRLFPEGESAGPETS